MRNSLGTEKIILAIIGGLTLLLIILIVILSANEQKQAKTQGSIVTYQVNDSERPKMTTSTLFADLGTMKVKDEKAAEFTIENIGNKPLQLYKISTSCDCTFAQIAIDGVKSPEFTMHSKNPWVGTIEQGKKASLLVIYRPYIMPVSGLVTRDTYIQTNDPEKPKLTFTVKANVE